MNVAQKSSLTPRTMWSSSRESYGAFFRSYGFLRSRYHASSTPAFCAAEICVRSQLNCSSSTSAQSISAAHTVMRSWN